MATYDSDIYDEDEPLVLEGQTLTQSDIDDLIGVPIEVADCTFDSCDLSAMVLCGVRKSSFTGCKLRGTRFTKHVRDTVFRDCVLHECTFRIITIEQVTFEQSALTACDFYGSEVSRASFPKSSFEGVGFDACTVEEVDLTGATSLVVGDPRTLQGAALCESQLPAIAYRLAELSGITVSDC